MDHAPHPKAPGLEAGVSEAMIEALVVAFYARIREHPVLGPVFNARIDDWDAHIAKLCAFWSSVALMTGCYKGRPMPVHAAIHEITGDHFEAWLALFRETAGEICPPAAAALFIDRAERIAQSLHLGIRLHRGEIMPQMIADRLL
jgi:hemoglobin